MRASRISQEVGRIFGSGANSGSSGTGAMTTTASSGQQELRRSSRSSALARFAYTGGAAAVATDGTKAASTTTSSRSSRRGAATSRASTATATTTPDIEDVIPDLAQQDEAGASRKRRRITATAIATIKTEPRAAVGGSPSRAARGTATRTRITRGVVKKEEEEVSEESDAASLSVHKRDATDDLDDDDDAAFAPSASDNETKPVLPIRRKRERKPARIARTTTTTTTTAMASDDLGSSATTTTRTTTTTTTILPPARWEEMFALLHKIRTTPGSPAANAAVDTMGCERLALPTASARDQRFQTLIALMLSSQTKDTTNAAAMHRLHTELPAAAPASSPSANPSSPSTTPGLNLENILAVDPAKLNELIWAVGFHNNKTKYIKAAAVICRDAWGGDIPDTFEGLVSLPGVGPKMAHLTLSAAWGRTEGIGVDVHVHRITNMWGWTGKAGTKQPEDTRKALEAWLPRDKWRDINWLLVGLGQTVCGPVTKRCGECGIGLAGLCRAADRKKINAARRGGAGGGAGIGGAGLKGEEEEEEEEEEDTTKKKEEDVEGETKGGSLVDVKHETLGVKKEEKGPVAGNTIIKEDDHTAAGAADDDDGEKRLAIQVKKEEGQGQTSPLVKREDAATAAASAGEDVKIKIKIEEG